MNFRGTGREAESATARGAHILLHTLLESPDLLAEVNARLAARDHQAINYGDLRSALHLHYLCHALDLDFALYVSIGGMEARAARVRRRVDSIGRVDRAVIIEAD